MSTHVQYVTLPGRPVSEEAKRFSHNLLENPESFKCRLLGKLCIDFNSGDLYLCVWQCQISKRVFWAEISGQQAEDNAVLLETEHEYGYHYTPGTPTKPAVHAHPVTHDNLNQFCHFVRGWRPDCVMHDKIERENLVAAIRQVFTHAVV